MKCHRLRFFLNDIYLNSIHKTNVLLCWLLFFFSLIPFDLVLLREHRQNKKIYSNSNMMSMNMKRRTFQILSSYFNNIQQNAYKLIQNPNWWLINDLDSTIICFIDCSLFCCCVVIFRFFLMYSGKKAFCFSKFENGAAIQNQSIFVIFHKNIRSFQ